MARSAAPLRPDGPQCPLVPPEAWCLGSGVGGSRALAECLLPLDEDLLQRQEPAHHL